MTDDDMVQKVITGYTLWMAQRRQPGDITRIQDRDNAVRFLYAYEILSPEQLDVHISTLVRNEIDLYGMPRVPSGITGELARGAASSGSSMHASPTGPIVRDEAGQVVQGVHRSRAMEQVTGKRLVP